MKCGRKGQVGPEELVGQINTLQDSPLQCSVVVTNLAIGHRVTITTPPTTLLFDQELTHNLKVKDHNTTFL